MAVSTYLSIITLNVDRLNALIKRHRVADGVKKTKTKQDPLICSIQEVHFRAKNTPRLKVRRWKKIFHANRNDKKAGVAMFISDKIDFKTKTITKDKEGYYIMIKGSIQEEDIKLVKYMHPI